jgi:hypothetical protein
MTLEKTLSDIEAEAQALVVFSGYKITIEEARDRVCESLGWVNYAHCVRCKSFRGKG